jgi:decaprenylphospho-beta-D-ribofuranose 2-oxidase
MKPEIFWRGYPTAQNFLDIVKKYNPQFKINSIQALRLNITQ